MSTSSGTADTAIINAAALQAAAMPPEHQIAQMLGLCESQLESAQHESDQSVDALVQAFTSMAEITRNIGAQAAALPVERGSAEGAELQAQLAKLSQQMAAAVVAFQFYDKFTQRLGHVRYSLSALALFVCNPAQVQQPEQWAKLHSTLRRLYRTQAEREVFQMVMDGSESALENTSVALRGPAATGDIELF